jgi:tetratricopeptide (TPR) repeat protein
VITLSLGAAVLVASLLLAPLALRPLAVRAFADIGRTLSASSLSALDVASSRTTAFEAWMREVSLVSLGIAAAGVVLALIRTRTRAVFLPFIVFLALDTLLPARTAGALSADPLASFRCLAVASIAVGSALGVSEIVGYLRRARVPMAKSGAVLVVVFHVTLVALTSEEAGFSADRSEQLAAEVWADEALGGLEPRAAILVRSPAVAWRLWAARVTRGERPDVIVIPSPLLNRGRVASSLLAEGRAIEPLIRDFALTGEPSELALSALADARPLHVELDFRWSKRLVSHLMVDGLWLEYAPQPLGPSDRKLAANAQAAPLKRALAAITSSIAPDTSTASVIASTKTGQANVLTTLGDYEAAQALFDRAASLTPRSAGASGSTLKYAIGGVRRALALRDAERARASAHQARP